MSDIVTGQLIHTHPRDRVSEAVVAIPGSTVLNPCANCGGFAALVHVSVDDERIVRCPGCGLVRQELRPASPSDLYDQSYYMHDVPKGGYANYVLDAGINRRTFHRRLRSFERRVPDRGRLLDVGAALGDFVLEASALGWDAEGVEISSFAAEQARLRGARVHTGSLEQLGLPSASYDVITLYDAIEHLFDPAGTLTEISRLLRPGGVLHLVTPNVGGLQARLLGRFWYHYKPGEHLYYFSPDTLRPLVERSDLLWDGWAPSGSYVTLSYVFNRLRHYSRQPFAAFDSIGRKLRLGPAAFYLYVGEMEIWGSRPR